MSWEVSARAQSVRYVVTLPSARRKLILIILLELHCDCKHLDNQLVTSYYHHDHLDHRVVTSIIIMINSEE